MAMTFKEERKLLTNQYYDEFLNKYLSIIFKGNLTNKTLEEIKRFKEIASDEDILIRTELSINSKNIWLSVICRLTHCSFRFGLKYSPVFETAIEKLSYSKYSGNNEEVKTIIQDLENNYFKYSIQIKHYNIKEKFLFLFYEISKGPSPEVIVYLTIDIQDLEKTKLEIEGDKYLKERLGL